MRTQVDKLLYKFYWIWWILGLHYISLYYLFFKNLKKVLLKKVSEDAYFLVLIIFFFFQLLSSLFSTISDYYSLNRLIAILHNEVVFLFIIVGYVIYEDKKTKQIIKSNTLPLLFWVSTVVAVTGLASYFLNKDLYFDNFISKFVSSYPQTVFTKTGWYEGEKQVRNMAFTIYPNSTAIMLMLLYAIAYEDLVKRNFIVRFIITALILLGVVFTGSRIVTLFALVNIVFLFFKKPLSFKAVVVASVIIIIPLAQYFIDQLNEIYSARSSSNDTRYYIQSFSWNLMLKEAPIIGLGLKPRLNELFGGEYPVGSHSTYIGYYVKNGLIGGSFIFLFFLKLFSTSVLTVLKENFSYIKLVLNILFIEILIILFFEDIDAYEMNGLLFGFFIANVKSTSGKSFSEMEEKPLYASKTKTDKATESYLQV
ncbi:O-antigen ligase family protein [Pontibacter mangrovi]|uniref:O-antigen ligase family protein n=1 Tax=Pontibacter mangrovi TaxID=2589816 RepID=A0A501W2X5_9BACT|nr:O-antigen ligase family protein [Pontibacter mangrovi]TPE42985.1 O-antigen ligase family protein [Pontibacter mangrovi]